MNIMTHPTHPRRIGVISDTHGHLDPQVAKVLADVDLILHAGDIDTPAVLRKLEQIAPVVAVRGNMDQGSWARNLKSRELIPMGKHWIYMLHDCTRLDLDPRNADIRLIIHGHTHRAELKSQQEITYLNPGSASLPRGAQPPSLAIVHLNSRGDSPPTPRVELIELE
jgi:putative phosphoesterase